MKLHAAGGVRGLWNEKSSKIFPYFFRFVFPVALAL